jgi:hypothetical protein
MKKESNTKVVDVINGYYVEIQEKQYTVCKDYEFQSKKDNTTQIRKGVFGFFGSMEMALKQIATLTTNENVKDKSTIHEYIVELKIVKQQIEQIIKGALK